MSIKYRYSLGQLNIRDQIDLESIVIINPKFTKLTYHLNNNEIIFDAKINDNQLLANQEFDTVEKLIIVKNLLNLYSLDHDYEFSLNTYNVVVLSNLDVQVVIRDVKVSHPSTNYLDKVKAILFELVEPKYNYNDYLNGGFDLVANNKMLSKYINVYNIDQFNEMLDQDIYYEKNRVKNEYRLIKNRSYQFNKIYRITSIILTVILLFLLLVYINKYNLTTNINTINQNFINQDYTSVVDNSKKIKLNKLSKEDKYIVAKSFVEVQEMEKTQKQIFLSQITLESSENVLDFWIYLSRDEFSDAYEQAYEAKDNNLLRYGYNKEIEYVTDSSKYNLDEKERKIKELQGKIEELNKG